MKDFCKIRCETLSDWASSAQGYTVLQWLPSCCRCAKIISTLSYSCTQLLQVATPEKRNTGKMTLLLVVLVYAFIAKKYQLYHIRHS
jgi:hypothetical protein